MGAPRAFRVHAVIIRRRVLGEADRVLTVFTKETGKITVLAKGVRKIPSRRAGHIELFTSALLVLYRGKTWDTVSDSQTLYGFSHIRQNLALVAAAYYLCELVDVLLPEGQVHEDVYNILLAALGQLETAEHADIPVVVRDFSHKLLVALGYVSTERPAAKRFHAYIEQITERKLKTLSFLTRSFLEGRLQNG
jgi:DNA repair protein RecO (recombination protein O)